MTAAEAYKIHISQAQKVGEMLGIAPYELAKYAFAVQKVENRQFNPAATNKSSSARGMMQMLKGTQKEIETKYLKKDFVPDRIFNAEYAVFLGQYELGRQLNRYKGNWRKAVHAYNQGSYQEKKSKSKGFAAGENYTNGVMNELYKTDYAALNNESGYNVTAANGTGKITSLYQEWA